MKIVGFQTNEGLRLGVVEGEKVIDLQAVDPKVADQSRPTSWRDNGGDLNPLGDLAKRAPASARRPLKGLQARPSGGAPGKIICLGLNYLEHVKEGMNRDNVPKFPTIFMRCQTSLRPARRADHAPARDRDPRLGSRDGRRRRQARQASDDGQRLFLHRRLSRASTKARSASSSARPRNGTWARTSITPAASAPGWSPPTRCRPAARA